MPTPIRVRHIRIENRAPTSSDNSGNNAPVSEQNPNATLENTIDRKLWLHLDTAAGIADLYICEDAEAGTWRRLTVKVHQPADEAARLALTGVREGDVAIQGDPAGLFFRQGGEWVSVGAIGNGGSFNHQLSEALNAQGHRIDNAGQITPHIPDPLSYASTRSVSMAGSYYQRVEALEGNITIGLQDVEPGRYVVLALHQDGTGGRALSGITLPEGYDLGMPGGLSSLQLDPVAGALTKLHMVAGHGHVTAWVEHVAEPSFTAYDLGDPVRVVDDEAERLGLTVPIGTIIGQADDDSQWLRGPDGTGPESDGWWRLGTGDGEGGAVDPSEIEVGGDLEGNAADARVVALRVAGGTRVEVGAIFDGQAVRRVGGTFVGEPWPGGNEFVGSASVDIAAETPTAVAERGDVEDVTRDSAGVYHVDFDHHVLFDDSEGITLLSRYQALVYPQPDTITWDSVEDGQARKLRMVLDFGADPERFDFTVSKIGDTEPAPAPTVAFVSPEDDDTISATQDIVIEATNALDVTVAIGGGSPIAVPHDEGDTYRLVDGLDMGELSDGPLQLVATATGLGGQDTDTIDVTVSAPTFAPLAMQFAFDEAASGTDPEDALNSGTLGSGSDMPILYEENASYTTTPNGRGIEFGDSGAGRLHRQITTAERTLIGGSTTWYFEYVFDFTELFTGNGKHAIGVDLEGSGESHLGMRIAGDYFDGDEALVLLQMHHETGQVGSGFLLGDGTTLTGKWVVQGVIDTTQEDPEDRFRVYARNASGWQQYPHQLGSYPAQDAEILEPGADRNIIIANIPLLHLDLGAEGILMGAGMGPTIPADLEARSQALWDNDGALGGA